MKNILDLLNELGIDTQTGNMETVLKSISDKWNGKPKHYLGDVKWVLYQYICDMGCAVDNIVYIRCGSFAFNKLVPFDKEKQQKNNQESEIVNLNGERVVVFRSYVLDKKQLIISTHDFSNNTDKILTDEILMDDTVYPNDIVLYFA